MKDSFVWVLNPDAERELGAAASYAVKSAFKARISERRALFEKLCRGEPFFFAHELAQVAFCTRALLWCPTDYGKNCAREAGLVVAPSPTMRVLRRVHDKRFLSQALDQIALRGRRVIESDLAWREYLAASQGDVRVKRFFGYAGKGQRVWKKEGGRDDELWLTDSLRQGGFVAEPNWSEASQFSLHGFVDADGIVVGDPCILETDRSGAPVDVRAMGVKEGSVELATLRDLAVKCGEQLLETGYFGPFGLDILDGPDGPRVIDLNPRFTLGWSVGLGAKRSLVLERALDPVPPGPDWC